MAKLTRHNQVYSVWMYIIFGQQVNQETRMKLKLGKNMIQGAEYPAKTQLKRRSCVTAKSWADQAN